MGRLPGDPVERAATADLTDNQIAERRAGRVGTPILFPAAIVLFVRSQRRWAPPVFVLQAVLDTFLAVTQSPWWRLAVPLWLVMLTLHLALPRRLSPRLELLRD